MEIKIKDKIILTRKWKGKDKRKFISLMSQKNPDEKEIMNTLVHDCIESVNGMEYTKKIAFNVEEFKYLISMIRSESLGDEVKYNFFCTECKNSFERIYNITDIIRPEYCEGNLIKTENIEITIGEIKNPDVYYEKIKESEIYDFLLRIESINGSDAFTLDSLIEFIDDLDVSELDEILRQYRKLSFKIDDVNEFVCDCGHTEKFHFDEIPEFFPIDWFTTIFK